MTTNWYKKIAPFRLAIGWGIFVTVLSIIPGSELPHFDWGDLLSIDKIFHVVFYALLTWLILGGGIKTTENSQNLLKPTHVALACSAYGWALELVQLYLCSGRSFDVSDGVANTLGAYAAAYWWARRNRPTGDH